MPLSEIIEAIRGTRSYKPVGEIYPFQMDVPSRWKDGTPVMVEQHPMGGWRLRVNPFLYWTRDVLGYAPVIKPGTGYTACFRDETDAELFRLAFIEYWS